ncbi:MAG: tetratricopeptide repeat protein [Myxococcales bacterium]
MKAFLSATALACCLSACHEKAQTHLARGNVLGNQGKVAEAIAEYQAAAAADPSLSTPWLRLGNLLYDQGKKAQAMAAYRQATARNPGQVDAWIGLARTQSEEGHDADARASLRRAIDADPKNLYARLSRAQLALDDGDASAALADAKAASALNDRDPSVLYVYGSAMLAARDLSGAAAAFDRIASLDANSSLAPYGRARLALAEGKNTEALDALKAVVARAPAQRRAIASDPAFAALRGDPAFRALLGTDGG